MLKQLWYINVNDVMYFILGNELVQYTPDIGQIFEDDVNPDDDNTSRANLNTPLLDIGDDELLVSFMNSTMDSTVNSTLDSTVYSTGGTH